MSEALTSEKERNFNLVQVSKKLLKNNNNKKLHTQSSSFYNSASAILPSCFLESI